MWLPFAAAGGFGGSFVASTRTFGAQGSRRELLWWQARASDNLKQWIVRKGIGPRWMRAKFGNKRRQRSPTKHSVSSDQAEMRQGHSYRALGTYPVSHRCPTTPHENLSARDGCGGRGSFRLWKFVKSHQVERKIIYTGNRKAGLWISLSRLEAGLAGPERRWAMTIGC